ncbi:NADH oxidase [Pseudozyma hubeiensis SY62]|uniref:NADH oxidase n=1 Tax=Pseudozyma hubeiensis (strain SY62) TaxID=1305764 RepID=R9PC49_PSEHS|nr:NADH oxidase [Pseudozyma hubeiensis SY62]GAC98946.1 NADH oxidase [Pseudozyma hubeiensis SY62]
MAAPLGHRQLRRYRDYNVPKLTVTYPPASHIVRNADGVAALLAVHGEYVLVDDDIYRALLGKEIAVSKEGDVIRGHSYLHHHVVRPRSNYRVVHRNGNKLDNRRLNLKRVKEQGRTLPRERFMPPWIRHSRQVTREEAQIRDAYHRGRLTVKVRGGRRND